MSDVPVPQNPAPVTWSRKWSSSRLLTRQCFQLMKQDKEILLFPVLSAIILTVLAVAAGVVIFGLSFSMKASDVDTDSQAAQAIHYGGLFVFYFIATFVATFFQAGLTAIVHGRIQGKDLTFADGMKTAMRHAGKIFVWALISATVGLVMRFVSDKSKFIGKIVMGLFGVAWGILTMFIVPTLILEEGTVGDAIRRSGETFKKVWGESFITNFTIGLYMILFYLIGLVVFIALCFTGDLRIIIGGACVFALYVIGLSIVASSLNAIFYVVLYQYAVTGQVASGFDPNLVAGAMKKTA